MLQCNFYFRKERGVRVNLYIADLHFGHRAVINFDNRPFLDVDEMDRTLIELWNSRVAPDDNVYIVGDFAYRNEKPEEWYLQRLKGHKHLVIGNHDSKLLANEKAMGYIESVDKMMHVTDNGNQICIAHFPIAEWNGFYRGAYHIYGHIHNRTEITYHYMKQFDRALNAGACINNYTPSSLNELLRNNKIFKEQNV
mgnify:CR=1 FL=1